jgi:hypothetical protein
MKRRLITLFANFLQRRSHFAQIDFPRQGESYLVRDDGNRVVEMAMLCDVQLGDEIVMRTRDASTRYRVRGQVTTAHRLMLKQSRMLTLVTPSYAILASQC